MTHTEHPAGHVLQAYHDGELDAAIAADVGSHCRECDICRAELAELDLTEQLLARAPAPELPRTVWHRVRPGQAPEPRFKPAFGIAACVVGIVLGVLMGPIRFSAEETGTEVAWSGTVSLWDTGTTSSLLDVYQTGQD